MLPPSAASMFSITVSNQSKLVPTSYLHNPLGLQHSLNDYIIIIDVFLQSRTTKVRIFYGARSKENWYKLTSDLNSEGLVTPENDFFVNFPCIFGDHQNLGSPEHKLSRCIYVLHCNHSPLWHCTVLFLLFYSPSSCFTCETGPISFHKLPGTIDKLPYDFNWAHIKHLKSPLLGCHKICLWMFSIPVFTPSPVLNFRVIS